MNAPKITPLLTEVLLVLTILSCQVFAKESSTEDPNHYPGSWYRIALDSNGRYTVGDGYGYGAGTWYYYPETGWYRQWFYNQPFDAAGKGHLQYDVYVRAVDTTKPTSIEINVNWTTPQWSQLNAKQPPLPKDAPTAREELQYVLCRGLYRVDNQYIKPSAPSFTFTVDSYNPEWVSVDIRGQNAYVYGGVIRQSSSQQGACCNHQTGECTLTTKDGCKAPSEWLGLGTACDKCAKAAQMNFGDAPDTYKTLLASDGARHTIVPGVYLGRGVDAEPDGKPSPAANGDDLAGTNDEDGVVFTSPLSPGEPATIEVTASTQGYLNAWIDFNQDGTFAGAGKQIFKDQLLVPGVNKLSFNVPAGAAKGATFARFRFNTRGLLSYYGPAADGEVEDYRVAIAERLQPQINSGKGGLKWSQTPQPFDPATPFILNGWGEPSDLHLHQIVADDWRCDDDRPITGFQWCGSFQGWTQPTTPLEMPLAFYVAIWTDSAATQAGDPKGPSHPDTLVWETFCTHWTWNISGYYSDPRRPGDPGSPVQKTAPADPNPDTCFQFTCLLSQDDWFYPQPAADGGKSTPTVYWLSIAAFYDPNAPAPQHPWGWTTRPHFFNAGAVQIAGITLTASGGVSSWPPGPASRWQSGAAIEFPKATAWDLAFELFTNQGTNGRDPDLAPVYRFWSDKLGGHFYTIDEAEKSRLIQDYSTVWTFEGVAFYAYPPEKAPVGSKPVYRFWSDSLGRHFYSISETEKQKLVDEQSKVWTLEGVAWYAFD
jgi:hypothetical protein